MIPTKRRVVLRDEHDGADHRHLEACPRSGGALVIEGQDPGPGTAPVSRDGEYEWTRTIRPEHLPMVPGGPGRVGCADVVEVLAARFTGAGF